MRWDDLDFISIVFRMTIFAIVILFFSIFLSYMQQWQIQVEKAAVQKTVGDINRVLALKLYKLVLESQQDELIDLDGGNPFEILEEQGLLPKNYYGSVLADEKMEEQGWYFHLAKKQVIYKGKEHSMMYEQRFLFEDKDDIPGFNKAIDVVKILTLQKVESQ